MAQRPEGVRAEDIKLEELPLYGAALARERSERSAAFVGGPEFLMGVPVLPLSSNHISILRDLPSPFLAGGRPTADDVCAFLWIVSPSFARASAARDGLEPFAPRIAGWLFRRAHRVFFRRIKKLPFMRVSASGFESPVTDAICRYVDRAMADAPGERSVCGGISAEYYAAQVGLVASVAAAFGWSEDAILAMPLRRLNQYCRWIAMRNSDGSFHPINRSDRVRREEIEALMGDN